MPTPGVGSIAALSELLDVTPDRCLKTLLVRGSEAPAVALLLRGDHELNAVKAAQLPGVATPLTMLRGPEVLEAAAAPAGSIGPVGLSLPMYVDHAAAALADFVCGANEEGVHLTGVNWSRDVALPTPADLRNAVAGDPSPAGGGPLKMARGIEVGQIFALGTKYSEAMSATVLDPAGQPRQMPMGCYGIGVTRVIAAAVEQNHDDNGIVWPEALSPFDVIVIPINMDKSDAVRDAATEIYAELTRAGFDVALDDRPQRPGSKFADADLIGIPHRIVVSDRGLAAGTLEYKARRAAEAESIDRGSVVSELRSRVSRPALD